MVRAFIAAALILAARGFASATDTVTMQASGACSVNTVRFGGSASQCAPGAGLRWMHSEIGAVWKVGLGVDHWRYGQPKRPFNDRGGSATLGQVLIQHDFAEESTRPYAQIGGGFLNSSLHTRSHPLDIAASGALGFESGDSLVFGLEARVVFVKLDGERFDGKNALMFVPSARIGWRFK